MLLTAPTQEHAEMRNSAIAKEQGRTLLRACSLQVLSAARALVCVVGSLLSSQCRNQTQSAPAAPCPGWQRGAASSSGQIQWAPSSSPAAHTALGSHTVVKETFLRALAAGSAALQQTAAVQHGRSLIKALQWGQGALRRPRAPQAAAPRGRNTRSSLLGLPPEKP